MITTTWATLCGVSYSRLTMPLLVAARGIKLMVWKLGVLCAIEIYWQKTI
jgi:hypothetical protein